MGVYFINIVGTSTSETENYVMVQTQRIWKDQKETHAVSIDFEMDSLLKHLKLLPTKKYFLAMTEILGKTNDAKSSDKSI